MRYILFYIPYNLFISNDFLDKIEFIVDPMYNKDEYNGIKVKHPTEVRFENSYIFISPNQQYLSAIKFLKERNINNYCLLTRWKGNDDIPYPFHLHDLQNSYLQHKNREYLQKSIKCDFLFDLSHNINWEKEIENICNNTNEFIIMDTLFELERDFNKRILQGRPLDLQIVDIVKECKKFNFQLKEGYPLGEDYFLHFVKA